MPGSDIVASDPVATTLERAATLGAATREDNAAVTSAADLVIVAVKPQVLGDVCRSLAPTLDDGQLMLSIAAGVPMSALRTWCPTARWVRAMPNTPALVGTGMTALHADDDVDTSARTLAEEVMRAAGDVIWVSEEAQLDAVTAVSGSGPAYFFYLMETMIDAGAALGLDRDTVVRLTLQTALGAARMAQTSDDSPAELRRKVTSPGGTTQAAISILEQHDVASAVHAALNAAARRSQELATEFGA